MLKILVGVGLGFLLFTNPEARQITADLLRSTANAIAPENDGKTAQTARRILCWRRSWKRNEDPLNLISP